MSTPEIVLSVTGGGTEAIGRMLREGGASYWFLEANVPYSNASLDNLLGFKPEKYCSEQTARQMALASYKRAIALGSLSSDAVGIGCTASLAKHAGMPEREGRKHEAYIAIQDYNSLEILNYTLGKNRNRLEEEDFVANVLCNIMKEYIGDNNTILKKRFADDLYFNKIVFDNNDLLDVMISNKRICRYIDYVHTSTLHPVIYPGSFNPIHEGHFAIIDAATKQYCQKPYLEISVNNVDKCPLDLFDVYKRIEQIKTLAKDKLSGIIISNNALFYNKLCSMSGCTYLLGSDTLNRLYDRRYGDPEPLFELARISGTNFAVAERPGHPVNIPDKDRGKLPISYLGITTPDISSTELRATQ